MRIALALCSTLPDWEVDDRPLHAALARAGVDAQVVAWDDPGIAWEGFEACLIRTTWDYTRRRNEFVRWAAHVSERTTLFNPLPVIEWNTHKTYLRDLESRGAPCIPTVWLERGSRVNLRGILAERAWPQAFLKPTVGLAAERTLRFDCDEAGIAGAQRHAERVLADDGLLLQPYLRRVETEGEVSAIWMDGAVTHCVRKIPVPGDYRVQDDHGASDEPVRFSDDERALVQGIVAAVDADLLYARVDLLRDDDGDLRVTELELVEPSLFFRHAPEAASRLVEALVRRVG
jgi:glutathione synthase/RimK-type ligase-like ATP-grasp enzyme